MPLILRSVARSDVGRVREQNEDSGYAGPRVLVVADGMGGHAAGEVASAVTVETVAALEQAVANMGRDDARAAITAAVIQADTRIQDLVDENPARSGMGTTLTTLLWTGDTVVLGHIGDSRGYLMRSGELTRITHDHTYVQSLVDEGRITEAQAGQHPARSLILKALDGRGQPEPDVLVIEIHADDRLMICSDGLTGCVSDTELAEVLGGVADLSEAADTLVRRALEAGAPDNVTVIVADVHEVSNEPGVADTFEAYFVGAAADEIRRRELMAGTKQGNDVADAHLDNLIDPGDGDQEVLRYAPRPPRRFTTLRRILAVGLAIAVLAGIVWAVVAWTQGQYFVAESDGQVGTYQGVRAELGPLGPSLISTAPSLPILALPENFQRDLAGDGIAAESEADAERIIDNLREQACTAHPPTSAPFYGLSCVGVSAGFS